MRAPLIAEERRQLAATTRRGFAQAAAGCALSALAMPTIVRARNLPDKLNIALVGVGGQGADNHRTVAAGNTIVALCDVDENSLREAAKTSPGARTFHDFRKMLDELHGRIDAVVVSTPDHTHAVVAKSAMELGKHVYCEKPLVHSIHEARVLAETARRHKVATQMGNTGHSSEGTRRVVEAIQAGAIGPVREVHAWSNRPIWPQGIDRPADRPPVPRRCTGTSGLAPRPNGPTTRPTILSSGAAGGISAPAPSATWVATSSMRHSGHRPDRSSRDRGGEPADLAASGNRSRMVDRPLRIRGTR